MKEIALILSMAIFFTSCLQPKVLTSPTSNINTGNSPTPNAPLSPIPPNVGGDSSGGGICSMGTGGEPGISDAGQTVEYFKLRDPLIVAHGAASGNVIWSSETNLPAAYSQSIFSTNTRFNLRVIPKRTQATVDSRGVACNFQNPERPFSKMQIGVRVRKVGVSYGDYYLFDNVQENCASGVHSFEVPQGTIQPLVIEVLDVKWDWSCTDYANQGYPNVPGVCPWDKVWLTECYALEIQFSTDTTKDIPGIKIY